MPHLTSQDLADYALRHEFALADARRAELDSHLQSCADCSAKLSEMESRARQVVLPADQHFQKLLDRTTPRRRLFIGWSLPARLAAAFAVCLLGYGTLVYVVNYRFDHGPMGLAEFEADYEFAQTPSVSRGIEKEPEDVRLFKEGVRMLFDAKETTLGLFPRYDENIVLRAEAIFSELAGHGSDEMLRVKARGFITKIKTMRRP